MAYAPLQRNRFEDSGMPVDLLRRRNLPRGSMVQPIEDDLMPRTLNEAGPPSLLHGSYNPLLDGPRPLSRQDARVDDTVPTDPISLVRTNDVPVSDTLPSNVPLTRSIADAPVTDTLPAPSLVGMLPKPTPEPPGNQFADALNSDPYAGMSRLERMQAKRDELADAPPKKMGFWKRLGLGMLQGLGAPGGDGSIGSMLGKMLGGAGVNAAVPSLLPKLQRQGELARADADIARTFGEQKASTDIAYDNARAGDLRRKPQSDALEAQAKALKEGEDRLWTLYKDGDYDPNGTDARSVTISENLKRLQGMGSTLELPARKVGDRFQGGFAPDGTETTFDPATGKRTYGENRAKPDNSSDKEEKDYNDKWGGLKSEADSARTALALARKQQADLDAIYNAGGDEDQRHGMDDDDYRSRREQLEDTANRAQTALTKAESGLKNLPKPMNISMQEAIKNRQLTPEQSTEAEATREAIMSAPAGAARDKAYKEFLRMLSGK